MLQDIARDLTTSSSETSTRSSPDKMFVMSNTDLPKQSYSVVNRVKVLVVDADTTVSNSIKVLLETFGYRVIQASDGASALRALSRAPDLIILDLELPDVDGLDLLRLLKQDRSTPIMILSAAGEEAFKVHALDAGATDYVTKPFGVGELLARIPKALRHGLQINGERSLFTVDGVEVDLVRRSVVVGGNFVKLSPKEFELLRLLIRHAGKTISHAFILESLWSPRTGRKYLHATVRRLRAKLGTPGGPNRLIQPVTGVGYRLRVEE